MPTSIRWWEKASDGSHFDETYCGLCQGDLHRKNILVSGENVFVIDFGLLGESHALRDFAKLERDILLFLYPVDSHDHTPHSELLPENDLNPQPNVGADDFIRKARAGINSIRLAAFSLIKDVEKWRYQYRVALLAQMIFAASDDNLSVNIRGLAVQYAWILEKSLEEENPKLGFSKAERRDAYRKDILWRFAYIFLRLDQLSSGGWGKSLPGWFEALVEADNNTIPRSPETRKRGGTDLTVYGFIEYLRFQARLSNVAVKSLSERINTVHTPSFRAVSNGAWTNLKDRIGHDGGIGTGHGRANDKPSVRHTAFGLVGALIYSIHRHRPPR